MKLSSTNIRFVSLGVVTALLANTAASFQQKGAPGFKKGPPAKNVSIDSIVKKPQMFEGSLVLVQGVLKKFEAKTSRANKPYFLFVVEDKKQVLNGYGQGKPQPWMKVGAKVKVQGIFRQLKVVNKGKPSEFKVKNEIDISPNGEAIVGMMQGN